MDGMPLLQEAGVKFEVACELFGFGVMFGAGRRRLAHGRHAGRLRGEEPSLALPLVDHGDKARVVADGAGFGVGLHRALSKEGAPPLFSNLGVAPRAVDLSGEHPAGEVLRTFRADPEIHFLGGRVEVRMAGFAANVEYGQNLDIPVPDGLVAFGAADFVLGHVLLVDERHIGDLVGVRYVAGEALGLAHRPLTLMGGHMATAALDSGFHIGLHVEQEPAVFGHPRGRTVTGPASAESPCGSLPFKMAEKADSGSHRNVSRLLA